MPRSCFCTLLVALSDLQPSSTRNTGSCQVSNPNVALQLWSVAFTAGTDAVTSALHQALHLPSVLSAAVVTQLLGRW